MTAIALSCRADRIGTPHPGEIMPRARPELIQVIAGVIVLTIGVLVYLLDRPTTSVYLIPAGWSIGAQWPPVFGVIGNHLPTFAHTFAFILFTSALLAPWRGSAFTACAGWWFIASVFEIAQSAAWSAAIAARVPPWFADWPLLDNVAGYFVAGRFDGLDLVSIALATVCAFGVIRLAQQRGRHHA